MKTAEVLKEHAFLEKMVGDWTVAASDMTGDKPWQETVRSLQGIWFVAEGAGEMTFELHMNRNKIACDDHFLHLDAEIGDR